MRAVTGKTALALMTSVLSAVAATVTLQQGVNGYTGCEDTYWYSLEGANSGGNGLNYVAGTLPYMELTRSSS